ncbi:hypothetical protein GCM10010358_68190 [Streptomyces minutiscleroticus]|uniref:Uncharacterized protein n=1 Tax=Streptomyces minutiscleroticus TaxID=68238 RepID=A0A918NY44_9ACTN|nr:hypothetical protein [Streptomyces minutiscleroticus]GGY05162.1 hypothetical protein GCM10010358_68190 [Streptomyces minutiscleroticus]
MRAVAVDEAEKTVEQFADDQLAAALDRGAALDPPDHNDVLRVHLPTRTVTLLSLDL